MVVTRASVVRPGSGMRSSIARTVAAAKRAKDRGDLSQAEKFEKAARDLGCNFADEKFTGVLQKLSTSKDN